MSHVPDWATPAALAAAISAALGAVAGWLRAGGEVRKARAEAEREAAALPEARWAEYSTRLEARVTVLETAVVGLRKALDSSEEARHRLSAEVTILKAQLENERRDHEDERKAWGIERASLEARVAKLESELDEIDARGNQP